MSKALTSYTAKQTGLEFRAYVYAADLSLEEIKRNAELVKDVTQHEEDREGAVAVLRQAYRIRRYMEMRNRVGTTVKTGRLLYNLAAEMERVLEKETVRERRINELAWECIAKMNRQRPPANKKRHAEMKEQMRRWEEELAYLVSLRS